MVLTDDNIAFAVKSAPARKRGIHYVARYDDEAVLQIRDGFKHIIAQNRIERPVVRKRSPFYVPEVVRLIAQECSECLFAFFDVLRL